MAKIVVDIPAEKLAETMAHLGARSKREAIEMALDRVNQQAGQEGNRRAAEAAYASWLVERRLSA